MRTPKPLLVVLAVGAAVFLAACQSTTPQASGPRHIEYDLFRSGLEAFPSPTETWEHDGPVEFLGVGMGDRYGANNPAEIVIGDLDSAIAVRVQVAVKYGFRAAPDDMYVEFRDADDNVLATVAVADSKSAVTGDFFEAVLQLRGVDAVTLPGGVIRAEVVNGVSFWHLNSDFFTPRAFVAFVLRDQVSPEVTSKGLTSYEDVYHLKEVPQRFVQTLTETLTFDAAPYPRPLRVDFAISELDPDPRVIDVVVRVGGATVYSDTLLAPNAGNELYLGYVLTTLPAGETDVEFELDSPNPTPLPEGDSVWLAGVNASVTDVPRGFEGCTPGYWRNHTGEGPGRQANAWEPTGFATTDLFRDPFDRIITVRTGGRTSATDPTLLQAVVALGGGTNALARHAVAALLNAAHPDVNSYYSVAEVIQLVQDALDGTGPYGIDGTKDLLEMANELGCPL